MKDQQANILLVDDRPENLLALEALLSTPNINLFKSLSGEEALKQVLKEEFALILLDVQMPGMDGFETAKLIKSREKSKNIPIIFVTAINKDLVHVRKGYLAGAIDYLMKPLDPETLLSKVKGFISIYFHKKEVIFQSEQLKASKEELEKVHHELSVRNVALHKAEAFSSVFGNTSTDSMIVLDYEHRIITVNPAVRQMFGYTESELIGKDISLLCPAFRLEENRRIRSNLQSNSLTVHDPYGNEIMALSHDGKSFPVELQVGEGIFEGKRIIACTFHDISERIEHIAALEYKASHDALTGLPNRTQLYDRLEQAIVASSDTSESFALFLIDLNRFKQVNDTYGHHQGDILLRQIGPRLREAICSSELIVRLGGDEFAILLPDTDVEKAVFLAEEILRNMDMPFKLEGDLNLSIGLSIGIVLFPDHGTDRKTLLHRADLSMYRAKRGGKGFAVYSPYQD